MDWILGGGRRSVRGPLLFRGRRSGADGNNTVTSYERSFFSKFTFLAFYILITKCSALLIPVTSTEIASNQLCPNPVDWQEPFSSLFPYRFFPNNVVVMDLVRNSGGGGGSDGGGKENDSVVNPCKFKIGGVDTGVKAGHALLLSLQQRPRPLSFGQRCSKVLEFPGRWGDDHSKSSLTCVTAEEPDRSDELNVNIRTVGQVKWGSGGRLIFDLPSQSTSAPFLIALFRVTTQSGACELQIQQYYWSKGNDSWSCAKDLKRKLLNNVCGRISCLKQEAILQELKGYAVPTSDVLLVEAVDEVTELPQNARIRTIAYFLKGLLLPLIISLSATLAYIIWRRRMKAASRGLDGAVSLGTQTSTGATATSTREEEVLIQFEEEIERQAKDKPPTYESLLEPPTYDQAMSPIPPSSPSKHFLDDEALETQHLLLCKTPPPLDDDVQQDDDKTMALTPTRTLSPGPSCSNLFIRIELDSPNADESLRLSPPPPFQ